MKRGDSGQAELERRWPQEVVPWIVSTKDHNPLLISSTNVDRVEDIRYGSSALLAYAYAS
jgi:hypothetical protein